MRKSNCCKAELLPRTVLCSKCLSKVKVEKLTAEDFIEDNVLNLPFKETLSEVRSVACGSPRFNKTLIIKFELDIDGMYVCNLPEDMDKVRVEREASYVVKYGKHVNKIKSLNKTNILFSVIGNHIVIDSHEFDKLKKSDLVLTFIYAKKNEVHSEKNNVCDREKSLKSFIYNLNIVGIENISKDRNKILKSNLDFLQLLSYANVNLHVTRFMDLGNGEVHVDFGRGFLPSTRPSVFTFITKWEYLDQILIKKMVVPISPVPILKCSLDNLPFPIKIGDKVLFQNRHVLLKYFNIGYHVLNNAFVNKYTIVDICKISKDLFKIIIGDNFNVYETHLLSLVDIFTLFGSDNILGVIVNPDQKYGKKVNPMQPEQHPFRPINAIPGFDSMGYLKAMSRPNFETNSVAYNNSTTDNKFDKPDGQNITDKAVSVPARGFMKYMPNPEEWRNICPNIVEEHPKSNIGTNSTTTTTKIDDPNLFSNGDYVTLKEKTIKEGIVKGFIKNPLGPIFQGDKCFKIVNTSLDTLTAEHTFVFVAGDTHFGFTIEADKVNKVVTKVRLPNDAFNILEKITEYTDMIGNSEQREELEKTILDKYPLGSMIHISKKDLMTAITDGYVAGHFGLDLDSDAYLEIINVAVNPISKRVSFTLRKNNVNCGFTIDIDKVDDIIYKPIEMKVNKQRIRKVETKK